MKISVECGLHDWTEGNLYYHNCNGFSFHFWFRIGCYRLSDGSFMKYINYSEMSLEVQISAPTFQDNRFCEVEQNFQFIRDGEEWQTSNEGKIFSVDYKSDSSIKELKVNKK